MNRESVNDAVGVILAKKAEGGGQIEADSAGAKPIVLLDSHYWEEVERIVLASAKQNELLLFTKEQRMLIDAGAVDERLVVNQTGNPARRWTEFKISLLKELYVKDIANPLYFSQWLADRYKWFVFSGGMERESAKGKEKSETKVLRDERRKIYTAIRPLFANIPGSSERAVALLFSGQLDSALDALTSFLTKGEDPIAAEQMKKMAEIRTRLITRARERAKTDEELALFDNLDQYDRKLHEAKEELPEQTSFVERIGKLPQRERIDFLTKELKLVRSLLKLGIPGSGITRTHSVLLTDQKRMTKSDMGPLLKKIKDLDPNLPTVPNILIAPYVGLGFYEWDRDTLFVPLIATRSIEEAVINAVANFRIMLDTLQDSGGLKKAYEMKFGKTDFRGSFIRDYKAWIGGVGAGFKGALDPASYDFFKDYIGPSADHLFAPREFHNLTPAERKNIIKECRGKLNRAEGGFDEHYKLAIVYWKEARIKESLDQMTMCIRIDPTDGRSLSALAYLHIYMGVKDKARRIYEECVEMAPNTIWQIYAQEALNKL